MTDNHAGQCMHAAVYYVSRYVPDIRADDSFASNSIREVNLGSVEEFTHIWYPIMMPF